MSDVFQVCIKHWALRALIWLSWGLCNWKLFYWSERKLYSDYITLFYCYITDFILAPKLHYVLQLELFHILIRNNRNTTAVFTIVWFRNIPHGKITSRGRPEKRLYVFRTTAYGHIYNTKGHIRSRWSLGRTQDVNLIIIYKRGFCGIFSFLSDFNCISDVALRK